MSPADFDPECERLVADLLGYMTPAEKAGQLALEEAPPPGDRVGFGSLLDKVRQGRVGCVHSIADGEQATLLQEVARDETRLGIPLLFPASTDRGLETVMPTPLAAAASWDADSLEDAEAVVAQEAQARGVNWALAPRVTLSQQGPHALPGTSGESVHLAATLAAARIRGLQDAGSLNEARLLAQLDLSDLVSGKGDEQADPVAFLRLACAAINEGKVASLQLDRLTAGQQRGLADAMRMLCAPGSFDGIVLPRWLDIARAAGAGDVDISRQGVPYDDLVAALDKGKVEAEAVDDAVARVLRMKFRHGLLRAALTAPHAQPSRPLPTPIHNREKALALARRCPVLLRNDPAILPLGIDSGELLLVGPAASDRQAPVPQGKGVAASVLDGLEQLGIPHRYVSGLALRDSVSATGGLTAADPMAIGMASEAAKRAGTVILVLENDERGSFGEAQEHLLSALANANPNLVLVNIGPCPVDPVYGRRPLACHLHAGQLGVMSGHAIAELLAGEFAPSGKLPVAILPEGASSGLPFGHGLNYADFALTNLSIEYSRDRLHAFVDLRNVSQREGTEVVQLYLRCLDAGAAQACESPHDLVDFQRLSLRGGQVETLVFDIGRDELGRFTEEGNFLVEPGTVEIFAGLSSKRGMSASVVIEADLARAIAHATVHPQAQGEEPVGRRRA